MQYVLILLLAGYMLGSINTALAVSKLRYGEDIRTKGSGNAGLTNALRTYGKGAAVMVLLGDVSKAIVAGLLGVLVHNIIMAPDFAGYVLGGQDFMNAYSSVAEAGLNPSAMAACFGAVLGHNWPVYFHFKGGKGVLVSAVTVFVLSWKIGLIVILLFAVIVAVTRYVSLGSIAAAVCYPVCILVSKLAGWQYGNWWYFGFAIILAAMLIYGHRANISRLVAGNENKLHF